MADHQFTPDYAASLQQNRCVICGVGSHEHGAAVDPRLTAEQMARIGPWVRSILGPQKADLWWRTPNPMFGGVKPYQMMLMGRERALYNFIQEAHESNGNLSPQTSGEHS